jgi:hypothetical protein
MTAFFYWGRMMAANRGFLIWRLSGEAGRVEDLARKTHRKTTRRERRVTMQDQLPLPHPK